MATSEEESLGVTPNYRVNQSDSHVYVEASCSETPDNVQPEAVCDGTIFALRSPPYYLPLHFPAPLLADVQIHRMGTLVRIDLLKETHGLEFVGLDDIQPTLFVDQASEAADGPAAAGAKRAADEDAKTILSEVLQREKITSVDDDTDEATAPKRNKGKQKASYFDLDDSVQRRNSQLAEEQENAAFDEQGYLDAFVDEHGEVASLLEWKPETSSQHNLTPDVSTSTPPETQAKLPALVEVLYAYQLALLHSSGPPVTSAWLLTSVARSMSDPPSVPASSAALTDVLRTGFRRGLTYPLHRSWKMCVRALDDLIEGLSSGGRAWVINSVKAVETCLQESEEHIQDGPDEAERYGKVRSRLIVPLMGSLQHLDGSSVDFLVAQLESTKPKLTKSLVGPGWDLELLEQMATEVLEEQAENAVERFAEPIIRCCQALTPPVEFIRETNDAYADVISPERTQVLERWRSEEAPALLRSLSRQDALLRLPIRAKTLDPDRRKSAVEIQQQTLLAASRFVSRVAGHNCKESRQISRRIVGRKPRPIEAIESILSSHVRPLFLSADPGSVNDQGRARHERANISSSTTTRGYEDERPAWKGGRGSLLLLSGEQEERCRSIALPSTLDVCLRAIAEYDDTSQQTKDRFDAWERLWPLLLPPLMRMIEDSDPKWRLSGTDLLQRYLLPSPKATQLLHRANLVPHLETILFSSLTYLSSSTAGVQLLDVALAALRSLSAPAQPDNSPVEQRASAQKLMRIVQEGILRVWTFAPRSVLEPPQPNDEDTISEDDDCDDEDGAGYDTTSADVDLLTVTFVHLRRLSNDLEMLMARYLDVTLDFLFAQIGGCYEALVEPAQQHKAVGYVDRRSQLRNRMRRLRRLTAAVQAASSIVQAVLPTRAEAPNSNNAATIKVPDLPPNLWPWVGRALACHVQAWLALTDSAVVEENIGTRTSQGLTLTREAREALRRGWSLWRDDVSRFVDTEQRSSLEEMEGKLRARIGKDIEGLLVARS